MNHTRQPRPRTPKYGNKKVEYNGIKFDSKKECRRYRELCLLQQAGQIYNLQLQVPYVLADRVKFKGAERTRPALRYVADFVYCTPQGKTVVEDAKGAKTEGYKIKKHLMKTVHGIDIKEV